MPTTQHLSDTELVLLYQKNKEPVHLGELYNRYYLKLYYYALRKIKNKTDAYDIAATTFLKVAEKIAELRNPTLFIAWIFKIAHNVFLDLIRSKRLLVMQGYTEQQDMGEEELIQLLLKEEKLEKLEKVMAELDTETKELVTKKYLNGLSIRTLQKEMNLSESAVKMRLLRAKEKLVKRMTCL